MKGFTQLEEILYRTVATYLAEGAIGLILLAVFLYFSRIYQRKSLNTWALSWLALAIFMISTAWISLGGVNNSNGIFRLFVSIISITACFSQVSLVLVGSFELTLNKNITRKQWLIGGLLVLFLSTSIVVFKHEVEGAAMLRYLIRVGVKYLIVAIGFIFAGGIILYKPQFTRGLGQKFLAISLIAIGLIDLYYAFIVFANYFGGTFQFPFFFGLLELICNSVIGISMVAWLLEDERAKLKKANKEMDSFLYSTSHDLRAPIASILGLTNLAKIELKDETALKYFDMVENRVKKMDSVISDILQLARSTKAELKFETVDFSKLLKEVIADLKFNKGAKSINLKVSQAPSTTFTSDYNQLRIILANLIGNAVKYHNVEQVEPFIAVRFQTTDTDTIIEIEDNGTGIAKEHQEKIFNMFYRASTQSEGTGLGLYIVTEAINKMHGKISLTSEKNKGSIFTVRLPKITTKLI